MDIFWILLSNLKGRNFLLVNCLLIVMRVWPNWADFSANLKRLILLYRKPPPITLGGANSDFRSRNIEHQKIYILRPQNSFAWGNRLGFTVLLYISFVILSNSLMRSDSIMFCRKNFLASFSSSFIKKFWSNDYTIIM